MENVSEKVWIKILSEFVPRGEVFSRQLYFLKKSWRNKVLRRLLVMQPFTDSSLHMRFWLNFCAKVDRLSVDPKRTPDEIYEYFLRTATDANGEIARDVDRTFPSHFSFSSKTEEGQLGRSKLMRLLMAVGAAQADVGYCQGMNFIGATLLLHLQMEEKNAFWMFLSILRNYHFLHLFSPQVPLLPLRMFHFSKLVRTFLPNLWHHLQEKNFAVDIFANQWIMTLFAYYLPPDVLGRVWDLFFLVGWKYLFQVGLTILSILEPILCEMEVEEISAFMSSSSSRCVGKEIPKIDMPFAQNVRTQHLLDSIEKFHVTHSQLEKLSTQFLYERLMQVINDLPEESKRSVSFDSAAATPRGRIDPDSFLVQEARNSPGFSWVFPKTGNSQPMYLQIDTLALYTPNRPHEQYAGSSAPAKSVWLPTNSVRGIYTSTLFVKNLYKKEISRLNAELVEIETLLMEENRYIAATRELLKKAENELTLAAKEKYVKSKILKLASSPNGSPTSSSVDLTKLANNAKHANDQFDSKRNTRDTLKQHLESMQNQIFELNSRKSALVVDITNTFSLSEESQCEIISRSIQSALDSFR